MSAIVDEMKKQFKCNEIYLSTDPENAKGKHIYEQCGFVSTDELCNGEELYYLQLLNK